MWYTLYVYIKITIYNVTILTNDIYINSYTKVFYLFFNLKIGDNISGYLNRIIGGFNYGVCVRPEFGYCGIEWSQASGDYTFAFSGDSSITRKYYFYNLLKIIKLFVINKMKLVYL